MSAKTSRVLHRSLLKTPPEVAGGEGVWLTDKVGKRYLDASGGAAVSCLGHNDPEVVAALVEQAETLAFAHTSFFTSPAAEDLAELLVRDAPGDLASVYYCGSGSEAVEAALKIARQYFVETGEPDRRHIIARRQSFHGSTLGALSAGSHLARRAPYEPLMFPVHHIAPCYAYRHKEVDESEEAYGRRVADELEAKIEELGEGRVIAFVAETVVGSTIGCAPPVPGYFKRIREICDAHGVLLILDEVMCGMGRTGTLHACEQEGIAPDIMTVAKGLAAGYAPLGAMLASEKIVTALRNGSGAFQHSHTFQGHPLACAAGLAVLTAVHERGLLANVRARGEQLSEALTERFGNHPHVGDIRGRGLFQALELVKDRATKESFDPALDLASRVKAAAFEAGLIVYPMGGAADGARGENVLLAPPYISTADDIAEIVARLGGAMDAALAGL